MTAVKLNQAERLGIKAERQEEPMIIKMLYEVPMHNKDVIQMGTSAFDEVSEYHMTETFHGDKRYVDLRFVDKKGNNRSFGVSGTAYVMSNDGKTVDTIRGGDEHENVSQDSGDDFPGLDPHEEPTEGETVEKDS